MSKAKRVMAASPLLGVGRADANDACSVNRSVITGLGADSSLFLPLVVNATVRHGGRES